VREHDQGNNGYLTNGEFKYAMILAGYLPVDRFELNWQYRARWRNKRDKAHRVDTIFRPAVEQMGKVVQA